VPSVTLVGATFLFASRLVSIYVIATSEAGRAFVKSLQLDSVVLLAIWSVLAEHQHVDPVP
jgi:hypothetical protein